MPKQRSLSPRHLSRWAVPVLALLAVLILPGIARAGTPLPVPVPLPTPPSGDPVGGLVGGLTGGGSNQPVAPQDPASPTAGQQAATTPGSTTSASTTQSGTPAPPSLDPSQLAPLFQALGVPQNCSTAVQNDLQQLIGDVPTTIQQIVDQIAGQLPTGGGLPSGPLALTDPQSGGKILLQEVQSPSGTPAPTFSSPDPQELPIVNDLKQLVTDLQNTCAPASPSSPPSAPAAPPGVQQVAPVQAAGQPQVQPVSYPGYAPTGSIATDAARQPAQAPLAALVAVLALVSGAAVAVTRFRIRAAREEG